MGTSTNQSSPATPNWRLATALLGNVGVSAERQSRELWTAAFADPQDALSQGLKSEPMAFACSLLERVGDPRSAVAHYDAHLNELHAAGLAFDIGRRALARAVIAGSGKAGFAQELFAEATSYYASRDLPSFVASFGRVENSTAAIALKDTLRSIAKGRAAQGGEPTARPAAWSAYVERVLRLLRAEGAHE